MAISLNIVFVDISLFHITIQLQIEKRIDVVLGIRTQGRKIIGADGSTELVILLLLQHAVGHREGKEERSGLGRRQGLQPFRHLSVVHRDGHEGGPHRDGVDQHLAPRVAHQSQERRLWDEPNSGKKCT